MIFIPDRGPVSGREKLKKYHPIFRDSGVQGVPCTSFVGWDCCPKRLENDQKSEGLAVPPAGRKYL